MTFLYVFCCLIDEPGTVQVSVSSCSDHERTWEDSQNKGKSMTTVRATLFLLSSNHVFICIFFLEIDQNFEYAS